MNLDDIQNLLILIDQFKLVKRSVINAGQEKIENENDVEHSYELAVFAWFLAQKANEQGDDLNIEKVIKYALTHDLVEAYAGDTDAFDEDALETKHEREEQAFHMLKEKFSYFPEMIDAIHTYEQQEDKESVFVKSVDKIQPVLTNMRDNGRSWKINHPNLTFEKLTVTKESKIKNSFILDIWFLLKEEIKKRNYFGE